MKFLAKSGFALLVLFALGVGYWAYYALKQSKRPRVEIAEHLPSGAVVYAECRDFFALHRDINSRSMVVDELQALTAFSEVCAFLKLADSTIRSSEFIMDQVRQSPFHLALYPEGSWILAFKLSSLGAVKKFEEELQKKFNARMINGNYTLMLSAGAGEIVLAIHDGAVYVSAAQDLAAKIQTVQNPLIAEESYQLFRKKFPVVSECRTLIDCERYFASVWSSKLALPVFQHRKHVMFELAARTSEIRLNGFCEGSGQNRPVFETRQLISMMPGSLNSFTAVVSDSVIAGGGVSEDSFWKAAADTALFNVKNAFYRNFVGVIVSGQSVSGEMLCFTPVTDTAQAAEQLQYMTDSVTGSGVCRLRMPVRLFDIPFRFAYATLVKGTLCFSDSHRVLEQVARQLKNNETLESNESIAAYVSLNMPAYFSKLIYCEPWNSPGTFMNIMGAGTQGIDLSRLQHFAYSEEQHHLRLHIQYGVREPSKRQREEILWTLQAEHPVIKGPGLFRNHHTNENELLFQDSAGTLYLVSAKGELIWKRRLDEKIISDFFTVDAYKNNKLQMLFNTGSKLYLVDRNGKDVEGFPVRLPAAASGGLSLFDYEKDKTYRVIVSCRDSVIYNYGIDGKQQATWIRPRTKDLVELPIQYANVAGSEYLIAVDRSGEIYLMNRRGQRRARLNNRALANSRAFLADAGMGAASSFIYYVDEKNMLLNKISFTDQKEITELKGAGNDCNCTFQQVDNNRFTDIACVDGDNAIAFDLAGNRIFSSALQVRGSDLQLCSLPEGITVVSYSEQEQRISVQSPSNKHTYEASGPGLYCELFGKGKSYLIFPKGRVLACGL